MKRNSLVFMMIFFLFIQIFLVFSFSERSDADNVSGSDISIEDLKNIDLSEKDGTAICSFVFSLLRNDAAEILPESLSIDRVPRMVCISVSDGEKPFTVFPGAGHGIVDALNVAISKVPDPVRLKARFIVFDVINRVTRVNKPPDAGEIVLQPGIEGLITDKGCFLPSQLLYRGIIDSRGKVDTGSLFATCNGWKISLPIEGTKENPGSTRLWIFTPTSFFSDGKTVLPLFRGHGIFTDLTEELLLQRISLGIGYLERSVNPTGAFDYSYQSDKGKVNSGYNILRHCGTLYSMLEVYEISRNDGILVKARLAMEYLLKQIIEDRTGGIRVALVAEGGSVKLGGNALAIIALAKYTEVTGDQAYLPLLRRLGKWIQVIQEPEGKFGIHKMAYPSGKVSSFVSAYYPGEAILSLVRLYSLDKDPLWLDIAEGAAKYLITIRDGKRTDSQLPHDHWLLYGLNELYRYRKNPLYVRHSLRIADAIISKQNSGNRFPDWEGGYYRPPGSTPTATRTEGLCAAYRLVQYTGKTEKEAEYISAIQKGVTFQLNTQIGEENAWHFPDPMRSLGGFRKSLTDGEIRIDYVQHNLSALIGLLRIMKEGN